MVSSHSEAAELLAEASMWREWQCFLYTTVGQRLILRATHAPEDDDTGNSGYLAFRLPQSVRTPTYFGEKASIDFRLEPAANPGGPVWKVSLISGEQTYDVVCNGVGFHRGPFHLPSPFHRAVDLFYRSHKVVRLFDEGANHRLQAFLGGVAHHLEWSGFHVSLQQLRLLAWGLHGSGVVELRFFGTDFIQLPSRITNARLRIASAEENQALRDRIPARLQHLTCPPHKLEYRLGEGEEARPDDIVIGDRAVLRPGAHAGHVVIDCHEGTFHILAAQVVLRRLQRRSYSFSRYLARPLWEGGPTVSEM